MRRTTPLIERLFARVEKQEDGCWIWTGALSVGYGVIGRGRADEGLVLTHRAAYELLIGPIPEGLTLDHLCRVRACCNPAHLEPVTLAENKRRGNSRNAINARKTECHRGHPFDEANTYVGKNGGRTCKTCRREGMRRYNRQKARVVEVPTRQEVGAA